MHYVANHRLTSEMLEQICKDDDVLEVTGEYTGGIGGWVLLMNIESTAIVIHMSTILEYVCRAIFFFKEQPETRTRTIACERTNTY